MKKTLLLTGFIAFTSIAAFAQVGLDSASNAATPVTTPPPPPSPPPAAIATPVAPETPAYTPPPPVATPAAPATTTTTTTVVTPTPATTTTTYVPHERSIDVNRVRFGAFIAPNISWMKPTASTDDDKNYNTESNGSNSALRTG